MYEFSLSVSLSREEIWWNNELKEFELSGADCNQTLKEKDLSRNSTESTTKFVSSFVIYLAAVQVDWGWVGWEMWSYFVARNMFSLLWSSQVKLAKKLLN